MKCVVDFFDEMRKTVQLLKRLNGWLYYYQSNDHNILDIICRSLSGTYDNAKSILGISLQMEISDLVNNDDNREFMQESEPWFF